MSTPLGPVVHTFFINHLVSTRGLRPSSIRSYRDSVRLFLCFVATTTKTRLTRLCVEDLTFELVAQFIASLEAGRGNRASTRNQRLAAVRSLFDYIAGRLPEMLDTCQRVMGIARKRAPEPQTFFLEREEVAAWLARLPSRGARAPRDKALLLFLYNTGARAQEVADLHREDVDLDGCRVRLHGKGDKWRTCPLWRETVAALRIAMESLETPPKQPVFAARKGQPLTRFGIYKIVRRHAALLERDRAAPKRKRVTPHVLRHTTAVHLLESGVELNVIRAWLGHADISTTNRYAEINIKAKEAALSACEPPVTSSGFSARPIWREDQALLDWLASL
jgi:site-specific recombinase XerD